MLTKLKKSAVKSAGGRFAIVASCYNARYVNALLRRAQAELRATGVRDIQVVRVPGAFEIPTVAARLATNPMGRPSAILCLGVIFQGETAHARQIGDAVSHALAQIQVLHQVPVIHGVFLFDTPDQARVRCLGRDHNRGVEVARTALAMVEVMRGL